MPPRTSPTRMRSTSIDVGTFEWWAIRNVSNCAGRPPAIEEDKTMTDDNTDRRCYLCGEPVTAIVKCWFEPEMMLAWICDDCWYAPLEEAYAEGKAMVQREVGEDDNRGHQ